MRQNNFLKTALLLVALVGGVDFSWADNVSIPQVMGDHIVLGDNSSNFASYVTTHTGCTLDNRLKKSDTEYVTVGTSKDGATLTLNVTATTAGDYVFGFKTGSQNGASTVAISMLKSGESTPKVIATSEVVTQDGNWDPNVVHNFYVGALEATGYTITLTITNTSGSYCGNFGLFYFHTVSQYPTWPTDGTTTIDLSGGTYYNSKYNSDGVISGLDNGGYMDNILLNNSTEGYYTLKFNVQDYKADGTLTATIYNMATGEAEITTEALAITSNGDKTIRLGKSLTTGLKRLRFDFTGTNTSGTIFNYKNVTFQFNSYDVLPIYGTAVLDLSKGSMTSNSNPRYSSTGGGTNNEISYIYNGDYADDFYVVIGGNETAYYNLRTTTSDYNNHEGTFKVTITDMATNTVEVNAQESATITSNGQSIVMPLTVALKPGLKKIRFDFVKDGESAWLYNIKDICFYKRSLNEGYDYTPVAATGVDVVLTRSITAGNWSTLCLPFSMTAEQVTATFGEGTKLATVGTYNSSTKSLSMTEATAISANVPCMIKVPANISEAKTIDGVTIVSGTPEVTIDGSDFKFVGVYTSTKMAAGDFFVANNQLYKATSSTQNIKPFRAYFTGVPANARLAFFDDETTGVNDVRSKMEDVRGDFYNLAGQRVAQPTKGLYIVNGKKVVIK